MPDDNEPKTLARTETPDGWNGDDHHVEVESAAEAGLRGADAALESFTRGFSEAIVVDDPKDHAVVAHGRTVLNKKQLNNVFNPAMRFLGIARDSFRVRLHDGEFEVRLDKTAVESAATAEGGPREALKAFLGFGGTGLLLYTMVVPWAGGIAWGIGMLVGGWQLRRGLVSGREMLAGKLAIALGMIAQEEGLVLPPTKDRPAPLPALESE